LRLPAIDLYQMPHHGQSSSGAPQLTHALAPLVTVFCNGPTKGGHESTYDSVLAGPGHEATWFVHTSENNPANKNPPVDRIANPSGIPDEAHFVHAKIDATGLITVRSSRTEHTETYQAR
jgi:hypothetical protein